MIIAGKLGLAYLFLVYCSGFAFYLLVWAGSFALISSITKQSKLPAMPRVEFGLALLASIISMLGPYLICLFLWESKPGVPLMVAASSLYIDWRRRREHELEREQWLGDLAGYGMGIIGIIVWMFEVLKQGAFSFLGLLQSAF